MSTTAIALIGMVMWSVALTFALVFTRAAAILKGDKELNAFQADGRDLNELLVENGLARIYGTRTVLYDGRDSRKYLAKLAELEAKAKLLKRGAWRFAK